jgi:hypothetical protein
MIDPEWTAGIGTLRKQRHGRRGDEFREWIIQVCHAYPTLLCATKYTELPPARKYLQLVRRCLPILETRLQHRCSVLRTISAVYSIAPCKPTHLSRF